MIIGGDVLLENIILYGDAKNKKERENYKNYE